jgi:hypothetical protein
VPPAPQKPGPVIQEAPTRTGISGNAGLTLRIGLLIQLGLNMADWGKLEEPVKKAMADLHLPNNEAGLRAAIAYVAYAEAPKHSLSPILDPPDDKRDALGRVMAEEAWKAPGFIAWLRADRGTQPARAYLRDVAQQVLESKRAPQDPPPWLAAAASAVQTAAAVEPLRFPNPPMVPYLPDGVKEGRDVVKADEDEWGRALYRLDDIANAVARLQAQAGGAGRGGPPGRRPDVSLPIPPERGSPHGGKVKILADTLLALQSEDRAGEINDRIAAACKIAERLRIEVVVTERDIRRGDTGEPIPQNLVATLDEIVRKTTEGLPLSPAEFPVAAQYMESLAESVGHPLRFTRDGAHAYRLTAAPPPSEPAAIHTGAAGEAAYTHLFPDAADPDGWTDSGRPIRLSTAPSSGGEARPRAPAPGGQTPPAGRVTQPDGASVSRPEFLIERWELGRPLGPFSTGFGTLMRNEYTDRNGKHKVVGYLSGPPDDPNLRTQLIDEITDMNRAREQGFPVMEERLVDLRLGPGDVRLAIIWDGDYEYIDPHGNFGSAANMNDGSLPSLEKISALFENTAIGRARYALGGDGGFVLAHIHGVYPKGAVSDGLFLDASTTNLVEIDGLTKIVRRAVNNKKFDTGGRTPEFTLDTEWLARNRNILPYGVVPPSIGLPDQASLAALEEGLLLPGSKGVTLTGIIEAGELWRLAKKWGVDLAIAETNVSGKRMAVLYSGEPGRVLVPDNSHLIAITHIDGDWHPTDTDRDEVTRRYRLRQDATGGNVPKRATFVIYGPDRGDLVRVFPSD